MTSPVLGWKAKQVPSMRIGEILGLTWDCVHMEDELIEQDEAYLYVEKELRRCEKESLKKLKEQQRDDVFFVFPEWKKTGCSTSLVLKTPKTESSVRMIYLPAYSTPSVPPVHSNDTTDSHNDTGSTQLDTALRAAPPAGGAAGCESEHFRQLYTSCVAKNSRIFRSPE